MSDLLPCPFCGCKADIIDENQANPFIVYCRNCHITTLNCKTYEDAENAWNNRIKNDDFEEYKEKHKKQIEDYEFAWDEGYREGYKAGVTECEPYMNCWISVKKQLPKHNENVLFYVPDPLSKIIRVGYILPEFSRGEVYRGIPAFWFVDDSENTAYAEDDVTHWMPIPKLPKEDNNNE